ncbi:MAG: hypothetical protein ACEQSL_03565 [Sediminibacterium sp.]
MSAVTDKLKSALSKKAINYYILYIIDDEKREMVKYSQQRQQFMKLFSCHRFNDKVEEVITELYLDENKIMHSKAMYDDDKIYMQAHNIFEANTKFKKFIAHKNTIQNEKEKTETATEAAELP